jgi:hypothetical protein
MNEITVYRNSEPITLIPTEENITYKHSLMSEHTIEVPGVRTTDVLPIQLGDYILYKGIKFKLNVVPDLIINHEGVYSLTFEAPKYTWYDKLFMHLGSNEFPYYGNARSVMLLFLENVNEIDPGWTLGEVEETADKQITFVSSDQGLFCNEAIKQIAEIFKLEFGVENKVISLVKRVGRDTNLSFEYGMNKGLFELQVKSVNDKNVVTKVYGFGGTKNLPSSYLAGNSRLTFPAKFHTANVELYGVKEGKYVNDDIYPHREANATAVTNEGGYTLSDSTLDFDINNYKTNESAKISFLSGELTGETFDITNYNHSTKTITYKGYTNSNNVPLPNANAQAAIGDQYTLLGIDLPASYVTTAETQVDVETLQFVTENSVPQLEYTAILDPLHLRDNNIQLQPGDRINFKDSRYGFDNTIRITEISHPITFPELITNNTAINITIANFVTYTTQQRIKADVLQVKNAVKVVDRNAIEQARRSFQNLRFLEESIFDTDGTFDSSKFNVGVLTAALGIFGVRSANFVLNSIYLNDNLDGDPNAVHISGGELIHLEMSNPGNQAIWQMQEVTETGLIPESLYYIYAKCNKSSQVGSFVITTDQIKPEDIEGFYMFLAGTIYPVIEGTRDSDFTNGVASINGNRIKIGKIESTDGTQYWNLNENLWNIGTALSGMNWGVTESGALAIEGKIIATNAEFVNLFVSNLRTAVTGRRLEITSQDNRLRFFGLIDGTNGGASTEYEGLVVGDNIDSNQSTGQSLAGIRTMNPNGNVSYLSGNGVLSNASGMGFLSAATGIRTNASAVGLLTSRNTDVNGISAAVVGVDQTSTGNSKSYAGYFQGDVKVTGNLIVGSSGTPPFTGSISYMQGGLAKSMLVQNGLIISHN